ncbi:MAG: hypothetical protein LBR70_04060 [Lactobacillaceae bacterium]|jgi:hypothetical protein|nr:hypothetical protein [Lactobacillaceae bacterium]
MKKYLYILAVICGLVITSHAFAQLPANPWTPQPPSPNDGYFGDVVPDQSPNPAPNAPVYGNGPTGGEILPVDPWARARDRSGIQTWRRSGNHGYLNYVGEATTWGTAYGQEAIAPEVNRHNMLVMTDHLRKMGYKIPAGYDQKIKDMPKAYKELLRENYDRLGSASDPFGKSFYRIMRDVEGGTGLDFENILFNTMDILATD